MPFVRISHPTGADAPALGRGVHRALVEAFGVPEDDLFQILTEHVPAAGLVRPASYLGIAYSDRFVMVQITVSDTRTVDQKKALYRAIADNLARDAGMRREDVMINLVEVRKENWSFGNGEAQYA
jgi:4-oxalocrotonate tautomerase